MKTTKKDEYGNEYRNEEGQIELVEVISCIKELSKDELLELMFDYSNYVMEQLENDNQPCCIMEYYENDWEIV